MSVLGIDRITYGVADVPACRRFFLDWGLRLVTESDTALDFEAMNGCEVRVRHMEDATLPPAFESGPTLREVIWGVESAADLERLRSALGRDAKWSEPEATLHATDPNGLAVAFRVTRKRPVEVTGVPINAWGVPGRGINRRSTVYQRAEPIEVGHVVFFTDRLADVERFYVERVGFRVSDRYPGRAVFLRCAETGGHHDLFLLQPPAPKRGLNHVAFTVRDIHEVFGGGMHISRCGWETEIGPGRHPISSAYFWYVKNPAGALAEYYSDEDQLDGNWEPQEFQQSPEAFAEWAVIGGIDGKSRRARSAP
ncbi:MAG: VOC family protein [Betaproteobacteria bacterium]|jgi:catechol 2,3-dioxygenase-like lactoylglutathione lyase family enzyme|nr:VOC family protein [Betaproteobacteria bacterium]